jgi:hypothetical protein
VKERASQDRCLSIEDFNFELELDSEVDSLSHYDVQNDGTIQQPISVKSSAHIIYYSLELPCNTILHNSSICPNTIRVGWYF